MCLNAIDSTFKAPLARKEILAWKVFAHFSRCAPRFPYQPLGGSYKVKQGRWLKAECSGTIASNSLYRVGFHCFQTRQAARRFAQMIYFSVVLRVRIRRVRLLGSQDGDACYVADEMFVPLAGTRAKTIRGKTERK